MTMETLSLHKGTQTIIMLGGGENHLFTVKYKKIPEMDTTFQKFYGAPRFL